MNAQGLSFLENRIHNNVTAADRDGGHTRALVLADLCIAEATAQGITLDDIGPEWGSVESIIYEAILHLDTPRAPSD